MPERTVSSPLSGDVIELLVGRGMTLGAIAEAIGTTKSFVSRVKSRSRSLTIDHLADLEARLGEPLPLLLLDATAGDAVPPSLKPLYRATRRVLGGGRGAKSSVSRRAKVA